MKKISLSIFLLYAMSAIGQEKLSLSDCYNLAEKNYPLVKQYVLLANQNALELELISNEKLPKLDFNAQATYQSDVTKVPFSIPNNPIEAPNKDQYKATVSANQLIFDGGLITASEENKKATLKTQQKQVEVSLYQLKKQINQLYFSVLLLQEKHNLLTYKQNQLEVKLKEVQAGIKYGVLLPASDKVLQAEILKIKQQLLETAKNKDHLYFKLSKLIGQEIKDATVVENPSEALELATVKPRPELALFELQRNQLETAGIFIDKKNNPKLFAFATGGYGNPGLNMLDNSFQPFYMTGIKLSWPIFDWNAAKKERQSLQISSALIDNQQEIFELTNEIELNQLQTEITKIESFITTDIEIIQLRKAVLEVAASQLKNGVITSSAYITELTNLFEAENNLAAHKIQLLLEKANYLITKGN